LGQNDLAMTDFNKAIELDPNDPIQHYNRGNLFLKLGQRDPAIADYQKSVELDPAYEDPRQALRNLGVPGY